MVLLVALAQLTEPGSGLRNPGLPYFSLVLVLTRVNWRILTLAEASPGLAWRCWPCPTLAKPQLWSGLTALLDLGPGLTNQGELVLALALVLLGSRTWLTRPDSGCSWTD